LSASANWRQSRGASFYREPAGEREENLVVMGLIDEAFLDCPFYGARQMMRHLRRLGWKAVASESAD
jgi:hypothetical protein